MNSTVTECARCSGKAGAHYGFCFIAQLWERVLGPGFPWMAPTPEEEIPLPEEPTDTDDWLEWINERGEAAAWPELDYPEEDPDYDRPPAPTGIPGDPPDPAGVLADVMTMHGAGGDGDWGAPELAERYRAATVGLQCIEVAKTELPDGYLDDLCERQRPERNYNTQGLDLARQEKREAAEDAAVQFVYDCTDTVPGGRVKLNDLHARYLEWHEANDRPYLSKEYLRELLGEMGLRSEPGRMPGDRVAGRPPLLVHGCTLRQEEAVPQLPKVVIKAEPEERKKHALLGAKPGRELPQQWQELIEPLLTEQGWRYEPCNGNGRGKPRVITPDGKTVTLPSTPHPSGRTLQNTRSFLRKNGAKL